DHLNEGVPGNVDPEVHRVQGHELRLAAPLEHAQLEVGLDLGQEQHVAVAGGRRKLRLEVLEHVELRVERLAGVQIPAVLAGPEERLAAGYALDGRDIGSP